MKSKRVRSNGQTLPWGCASLTRVRLGQGLLGERQRVVIGHSIEQQYEQLKITGRLDAMRVVYREGSDKHPRPHEFWDSDIGKWIESASYALMQRRDAALEAKIDAVVGDISETQRADGYFNSFFQAVMPDRVFTNLRDQHELYCAGHLIEAAVVYERATGKRALLDVMLKYVEHIASVFGDRAGQKRGYDGHPEIELALMRLYRRTEDERHLKLAKFFIDARGEEPHFFDIESAARNEKPHGTDFHGLRYDYYQAHAPIRQQRDIEGHSVRALYLLAGAVDVAWATDDAALKRACLAMFESCVERRMYVNGGVGSTRHGERFTYDFDLPNESAYAETCANISLMFVAARLMNLTRDGRYADVMERALLNAVLPGVSLDGRSYFYANYLATDPKWQRFERAYPAERQPWFGCACCPPNVARLLASVGSYLYSVRPGEVSINLYADSVIEHEGLTIRQRTKYPWHEQVRLSIEGEGTTRLNLRVPGWCRGAVIKLNGRGVPLSGGRVVKGYVAVKVDAGDVVELLFPMPVERVYADVRVRQDVGRVALMRGPILYCVEEADVKSPVEALELPRRAKVEAKWKPKLLGGVMILEAQGIRRTSAAKGLYVTTAPKAQRAAIRWIPYYAWANRGLGQMAVWMRES